MIDAGSDIRSWIANLIIWCRRHGLEISRYTNTEAGVAFPLGMLYFNANDSASWKVSTFRNGPLDLDHFVVTEICGRGVRVRRGPVGHLKDVRYSPAIGDSRKLADASRGIAELLDEPLRAEFLDCFAGEATR